MHALDAASGRLYFHSKYDQSLNIPSTYCDCRVGYARRLSTYRGLFR